MQLKKKIHFDSVVAFFLLSVDKCLIFSNYYGVELHIIGGSGHMEMKEAEDALYLWVQIQVQLLKEAGFCTSCTKCTSCSY